MKSIGGLLPIDMLERIARPGTTLPKMKREDFHLLANDHVNECIKLSWSRLMNHWKISVKIENDVS